MSFRNPFKTHHAPKKSAISRTAEREFEREQKKIETLDEYTKKLYKDTKRSTESQTALSRCEVKMAGDFLGSSLCKEEDDLRKNVEQWNAAALQLEMLMHEMSSNSQKAVVEPMKKFSTVFPSVQAACKRREAALQEYNKCQAKVDKYQERERTGPNIVKLDQNKRALAVAQEDYLKQNSALMDDMPKLYEGRIDYLQPSFQALLKSQVKYYNECHKVYSELSQKLYQTKEPVSSEEYDQNTQQKLNEIKALSIVDDD